MTNNKFVKHIPNTLTLINMSLGLGAILLLIQSEHLHKTLLASVLIILGAFVDFFDGFFARKLNVVTAMGKQLDSFADIITFGIAPILLINYTSRCESAIFTIIPSLIFMMAGVYRLARYNLNDFSKHFIGLPITAAGVGLTIYCAISSFWLTSLRYDFHTVITIIFIFLLSFMMVSRKKVNRITF